MNDEEYCVFEVKMHMHGCCDGLSAGWSEVVRAGILLPLAFYECRAAHYPTYRANDNHNHNHNQGRLE